MSQQNPDKCEAVRAQRQTFIGEHIFVDIYFLPCPSRPKDQLQFSNALVCHIFFFAEAIFIDIFLCHCSFFIHPHTCVVKEKVY